MNFSKHPALCLIEDFCNSFNQRDIGGLLFLFTKNSNVMLWESDSSTKSFDNLKITFEKHWKRYEKCTLSVSSVKLSELPSCWAMGNFTLTSKIETDFYKYENLKGNLRGLKEGNTWKIEELRMMEKFFPSEIDLPTAQMQPTPFELYLT